MGKRHSPSGFPLCCHPAQLVMSFGNEALVGSFILKQADVSTPAFCLGKGDQHDLQRCDLGTRDTNSASFATHFRKIPHRSSISHLQTLTLL